MTTYEEAMHEVRNAALKDIDPYVMCVAKEITSAVKDSIRSARGRKSVRDKINEDMNELFKTAVEIMFKSAGASTPKDAAYGVLACYIDSGMDIDATRIYTTRSEFAMRFFHF